MTQKTPLTYIVLTNRKPLDERAHDFEDEGLSRVVSMWLHKNDIPHTRMNVTTLNKLRRYRDAEV